MALTQPRPSKEEDISAVLGRFKAWNTGIDAQLEAESKEFTGLEEISYEEALGDLGRRRVLARTETSRQVDLSTAIMAARDTPSISAESQLHAAQTKANSAPVASSHAADKVSSSSVAETVAAAAILPTFSTGRRAEETVSKQVKSASPKKATTVRASSGHPKKVNVTALAASSKSLPQRRTSRPKALAASKGVSNTVNAQLTTSPRPQPTFKAVLEDRLAADRKLGSPRSAAKTVVRIAAGNHAKSSMVPWVQSQAVSLKVRISAGEHVTIKAGASEAGLPLAAYMRQCTLDVEVLRKLLKQTIADIRTFEPSDAQTLLAAPAPNKVPPTPSRPGLLKRLKNAWLDRGPQLAS